MESHYQNSEYGDQGSGDRLQASEIRYMDLCSDSSDGRIGETSPLDLRTCEPEQVWTVPAGVLDRGIKIQESRSNTLVGLIAVFRFSVAMGPGVCYRLAANNGHLSPVAQLVEQAAVNRLVAGSSPARGANAHKGLGHFGLTSCFAE